MIAPRRLATNHFTGWGYWIWFIPLHDGEMSVGLVWDKRLVTPEGTTPLDKLTRFLETNPLTKQMIEGATVVEGDCRYYAHLPYFVDKFIGPGWTCVGDAGGFLDPFYSPGLDQMSFSVWTRTRLILKDFAGATPGGDGEGVRPPQPALRPLLQVLLRVDLPDKYYVMGDYDTMTIAFLLDTALYYFAAIMPIYRWSHERLGMPPFFEDGAEIGYYPIRFYNRRLVAIAQRKKALGIYGNHNAGKRPKFVGFSMRSAMWVMLFHGLLRWWKAELANAWTYVVRAASPSGAGGTSLRGSPAVAALPPRPPLASRRSEPATPSRARPDAPRISSAHADRARHRRLERDRARARDAARARPPRPRPRRAQPRPPRRSSPAASTEEFGVAARSSPRDLADPAAPLDDRRARSPSAGSTIDVLVNDAGFGVYGFFAETSLEKELEMIQVNVTALTHLTKLLLPGMLERRRGRILNVASTAAFQPGPAHGRLLRDQGLRPVVLRGARQRDSPAPASPSRRSAPARRSRSSRRRAGVRGDAPLPQARSSWTRRPSPAPATTGMLRGKRVVIPGVGNRALVQALRATPRDLATAIARKIQESKR